MSTITKFCIFLFLIISFSPSEVKAYDYFKNKPDFIKQNLKKSKYELDTSAAAIVLYESDDYEINFDSQTKTCKRRRIIKILNKAGLDEATIDITIPRSSKFYTKIKKVYGTTYNLDYDTVAATELNSEDIHRNAAKSYTQRQFAMPSVKVGSIIDCTVVTETDLKSYLFCEWNVQGKLPKLYTELDIYYLGEVELETVQQKLPYFEKVVKEGKEQLPEFYTTDEQIQQYTQRKWVAQNIKAVHDEPFIYDIDDFKQSMKIYYRGYIDNYGIAVEESESWDKANKLLYEDDKFYKAIDTKNEDILNATRKIVGNDTVQLSISKKIFAFIRDSIKKSDDGYILITRNLHKVLEDHSGSIAEKNLLLVSMLRMAGIVCNPVILSTRDNGTASFDYPELDDYNYVVCRASMGGVNYDLDASGKYNFFGLLPEDCYNGNARLIAQHGSVVIYHPSFPKENIFFGLATDTSSVDNYWITIKYNLGINESRVYREEWDGDQDKVKKFIKTFLKSIVLEPELKSYTVDNFDNPDHVLSFTIRAKINWPQEASTIYFNPFLYKYFSGNPFRDEDRKYPVELPSSLNITYDLNLKLPAGYVVDDTLSNLNMRFKEDMVYRDLFEYTKQNNTYSVRYNYKVTRVIYTNEEYFGLKEFLDKMLAQQEKSIVIKKL